MAYANGYTYKRTVTISGYGGSTDLTDFRMLFKGTYSYLADTSNGGKVINDSSNLDIRFETTGGTQLKHHVLAWDNTTGAIVAWVKIPSVTYASSAVVDLYYGKTIASTEQDADNTWGGPYKFVMPMFESSGTRYDYSGNNNDTISETDMTTGTGNIYSACASFVAANTAWMNVADSASLDITDAITIKAWIKPTSLTQFHEIAIKGRNDITTNTTNNYSLRYSSAGSLNFYYYDTTSTLNELRDSTNVVTTGEWQLVSVSHTFGAGTAAMRRNKSAVTAAWYGAGNSGDVGVASNSDKLIIGARRVDDAPSGYINGLIEQIVIYNGILSADWLDAEYDNQSSPATFYTLGDEETSSTTAVKDIMSGIVPFPR